MANLLKTLSSAKVLEKGWRAPSDSGYAPIELNDFSCKVQSPEVIFAVWWQQSLATQTSQGPKQTWHQRYEEQGFVRMLGTTGNLNPKTLKP